MTTLTVAPAVAGCDGLEELFDMTEQQINAEWGPHAAKHLRARRRGLCASCPIFEQCLSFSLSPDGVRSESYLAGLTQGQRRVQLSRATAARDRQAVSTLQQRRRRLRDQLAEVDEQLAACG